MKVGKTTNKNLLEQLLSTAEVFHYAKKFRNSTFILALEAAEDLDEILEDLRILALAEIRTLVCVPETNKLDVKIKSLNQLGVPLILKQLQITDRTESLSAENCAQFEVREFLGLKKANLEYWSHCLSIAKTINTSKIFLMSEFPGLEVDHNFLSNPTPTEIKEILISNKKTNISKELLKLIYENVNSSKLDIIILSADTGNLYQEIFTHYGNGTLFSDREVRRLRKARTSDIMDIILLMKPYIDSGSILPVTDEDILRELDSYHVLTVDGAVIASAKLNDYGEASEFAKFCTLPRYRGKGRAKSLAQQLLKVSAQNNKKYAFALTVDEHAAEFFLSLGFKEIPREVLPEAWKVKYDFNRPSKAYRIELNDILNTF